MRLSLLDLIGFRLGILLFLMVGVVGEGYGQRVYADRQQSSPKQNISILFGEIVLSEVTNQENSRDADTTKFSTLSVNVGVAGLFTAHQNLQFVDKPKPTENSPIIIKLGTNNSLLGLLDGFSVQRTNGGRTSLVNPAYSENQLLRLLNLFGGDKIATAIIPPNGQVFDGIRLEINTTLGVALAANYYYAFYITPPTINSSQFCFGKPKYPVISNFQTGYTYKIYNSEIGGNEITAMATSKDSIPLPTSLQVGTHTYWLEAREGNIYPSARTEFNVTIYPNPGIPQIEVK